MPSASCIQSAPLNDLEAVPKLKKLIAQSFTPLVFFSCALARKNISRKGAKRRRKTLED
jgi:hypothetical protein